MNFEGDKIPNARNRHRIGPKYFLAVSVGPTQALI